MEYRNLNTFLQVVESGSFSRAAEVLGYTQSTVSLQIISLEKELGCRLFDRINHTIALTNSGRELVPHAQAVRRSMEGLTDSFRSGERPRGQIRMVSSDSICEKMMLLNYHEFYENFPEIKLVFTTAETDAMLQALAHNEADVIFTLDSHIYSEDVVIARESAVPLHFVASASSPLASRRNLSVRDLLDYPFLLTEKGMSYRRLLDQKLAELSLEIEPVLETGRTDILARSVEGGLGVSFLPDFVTEDKVREGKLVRLDVKDVDLFIWKQLIYHKNKWISRPLQTFMEFVMAHEFEW